MLNSRLIASLAASLSLYACGLDSFPARPPAPRGDAGKPPPPSTASASDAGSDVEPDVPDMIDEGEPDAGEVNTCAPRSCDDRDPCTRDTRRVGMVACNEVCMHTLITTARAGDQCCPEGLTRAEDEDCEAGCGNGRVEPGERCDGGELCSDRCTPLFDASLIHRYSFEGTGNAAIDSIGEADGRIVGASLNGDGDLSLAGAPNDPYVDLPNRLISGLTSVTIEAWVTWRGGAPRQHLFDFGMSGSGEDVRPFDATSFFTLEPENSERRLATTINFTGTPFDTWSDRVVEARDALAVGERHHLAVTFDAGTDTLTLYLDGQSLGSRGGVTGALSQIDDRNVWIGRANSDEPGFRGTIHEFRIYNRALDAAAIEASERAGSDPDVAGE